MANANAVLVNQPGPLPISFKYTPESDIPATIALSGSVFTGDIVKSSVGFELKIDGEIVGRSTVYTGDTGGTHHATISTMVNCVIPFVIEESKVKPVTIELVPLNFDSMSNKDDFFNVTIFS